MHKDDLERMLPEREALLTEVIRAIVEQAAAERIERVKAGELDLYFWSRPMVTE